MEKYKRSNKFSEQVTVAQAAVEGLGLSTEQQELVLLDEAGLPYLAGMPDLTELAEAIFDAASRKKIDGLVTNEDGYSLSASKMQLDMASVRDFFARIGVHQRTTHAEPAPAPVPTSERLVTLHELCDRLRISSRTLYRRIDAGTIEKPSHLNPNRWQESYVRSLLAGASDAVE